MNTKRESIVGVLYSILLLVSMSVPAQHIEQPEPPSPISSRRVRIIPPIRPIRGSVVITGVKADVKIVEQVATTTIDIKLKNSTRQRLEAEVIMPVPDGVTVRAFDFQGAGKESSAKLMRHEEARKIYNDIVRQMRDPAILEFAGLNLVRSCVFPVEPNGTQQVKLTYEQILPADGQRVEFYLPRSESLSYKTPWEINVSIKSKTPISTVYSPSHEIFLKRKSKNHIDVILAEKDSKEPGSFYLSYLLEKNGLTSSLIAYPDPKVGGGYFLLLTGLPAQLNSKALQEAVKREVTIVIDRSGSMSGGKMKQVKEAAFQIIAGLDYGEAFNIITYNEGVEFYSAKPVIKSAETVKSVKEYLDKITARGGTNIHDALVESLRQEPVDKKMLPIVLFLTDGLPTIGETREKYIREVAEKGNPHQRRIFTFGVGVDVNTPLLDKIAKESRGNSTYVLPSEDVEVKVAAVFKRLYGPIFAYPNIKVCDADGKENPAKVEDLIPIKLPDLFDGDQLVLLGKYKDDKPIKFLLSGSYLGRERKFEFDFNYKNASTANSYVPRLWASRKIGFLIDAIRDMGVEPTTSSRPEDPRTKELVEEIVKLSLEFGILTEYTAFLALEGTNLADAKEVERAAAGSLNRRAKKDRSGVSAVNQSSNIGTLNEQKKLNRRNSYYDRNMQRVEVANIQQVNDLAFYNRRGQWIDSRVAKNVENDDIKPDQVIEFGTEEFDEVLTKLIKSNRQGSISLKGDIILEIDGKTVLVKAIK